MSCLCDMDNKDLYNFLYCYFLKVSDYLSINLTYEFKPMLKSFSNLLYEMKISDQFLDPEMLHYKSLNHYFDNYKALNDLCLSSVRNCLLLQYNDTVNSCWIDREDYIIVKEFQIRLEDVIYNMDKVDSFSLTLFLETLTNFVVTAIIFCHWRDSELLMKTFQRSTIVLLKALSRKNISSRGLYSLVEVSGNYDKFV